MINRNRSFVWLHNFKVRRRPFSPHCNTSTLLCVVNNVFHEKQIRCIHCSFHPWLWIRKKYAPFIFFFELVFFWKNKNGFSFFSFFECKYVPLSSSCVMSCQSTLHSQKKFLNILMHFLLLNIITSSITVVPYCLHNTFLHCLFLAKVWFKACYHLHWHLHCFLCFV